jgi:hypothetical protein
MQQWVATVDTDQFATERLYAHEAVTVTAPGVTPSAGDPVLLVVAGDLFGLGRIVSLQATDESATVRYTHRLLDDPLPVPLPPFTGLTAIPADVFDGIAVLVPANRRTDADRSEWFVSVAVPIEASSRAEAVREFWTYIDKLGPQELPAYVWPRGDELAMQSFVLGVPANEDPEEDAPTP